MRKTFISTVGSSVNPRDFARVLLVIQACIKPVVFANVWHEQLGHVKLQRVTALDREEKKRLEKKEKKEKDDEEERNRLTYNFVKYTLGLKHQVWKQKGEEYRVYGQWSWLWLSSNRKNKKVTTTVNKTPGGLQSGPQKMMVQIKDQAGIKILALDPTYYEALMTEYCPLDDSVVKKEETLKEEVKSQEAETDQQDKPENLETANIKSENEDDKKDIIKTESQGSFPKPDSKLNIPCKFS